MPVDFIGSLLIAILLLTSQDVYVPTVGQGVQKFTVAPGANLMINLTTPPQPLVVVSRTTLLAEVDTAKGQAAFDACTIGTVPPLQGPIGLSCENNRMAAINADIDARVKAAIKSIANSTLQTQKLRVVQ